MNVNTLKLIIKEGTVEIFIIYNKLSQSINQVGRRKNLKFNHGQVYDIHLSFHYLRTLTVNKIQIGQIGDLTIYKKDEMITGSHFLKNDKATLN